MQTAGKPASQGRPIEADHRVGDIGEGIRRRVKHQAAHPFREARGQHEGNGSAVRRADNVSLSDIFCIHKFDQSGRTSR